MKITVKNFRGVESASIDFQKTLLIAGKNFAGKSSICMAVGAALTGQDIPYLKADDNGKTTSVLLKSQSGTMVRGGMDAGMVSVSEGESAVSVSWPKCERQSVGKTPPQSSVYATGLVNVLSLSDKARSAFFTSLLKINPTEADLREAIGAEFNEEEISRFWKAIQDQGWDSAHKELKEHTARLKGRWEGTANTPYGATKADTWFPTDGWDDSLKSSSLDALSAAVTQANADLEKMISKQAVSAVVVQQWRTQAEVELGDDPVPKLSKAEEKLKFLEERNNKIPLPPNEEKTVQCPHCDNPVVVMGQLVKKPATKMTVKDKQANEQLRQQLVKEIEELNANISILVQQLREYEATKKSKAEAQAKIDSHVDVQTPEAEVNNAREHVRIATLHKTAFEAYTNANKLHASIKRNQTAIDVLATTGLRRTKLIRSLGLFNNKLASFSSGIGWARAEVDENLDIRYGGRHHLLCSASEQYRARCLLQAAIAELDESDVMIFDGADILTDAGSRGGLVNLVSQTSKKAIIGMSFPNKEKIPASEGSLSVAWIEQGLIV